MNRFGALLILSAAESRLIQPPNSVMLINAKAAAAMLGVSAHLMYDLAAPKGPVRCYRMGINSIRFHPADVEAYAKSCICEATREPWHGLQFFNDGYPNEAEIRRRFAEAGFPRVSIKAVQYKKRR
jgi:predicted DNA-binding transcriptional regulator AlpA